MPYYIFPNAFSEPKTRRGDVLPASLLHLRSRLPPCSAVLLRVPSAEARACARAWPRVGVPVTAVGLPLPPALVPPTGPEPPCVCVPQGFNAGVLSPSAPASCCSGSSPEFRCRGPSVLNARTQTEGQGCPGDGLYRNVGGSGITRCPLVLLPSTSPQVSQFMP
jgi:hypothetical protein